MLKHASQLAIELVHLEKLGLALLHLDQVEVLLDGFRFDFALAAAAKRAAFEVEGCLQLWLVLNLKCVFHQHDMYRCHVAALQREHSVDLHQHRVGILLQVVDIFRQHGF